MEKCSDSIEFKKHLINLLTQVGCVDTHTLKTRNIALQMYASVIQCSFCLHNLDFQIHIRSL